MLETKVALTDFQELGFCFHAWHIRIDHADVEL